MLIYNNGIVKDVTLEKIIAITLLMFLNIKIRSIHLKYLWNHKRLELNELIGFTNLLDEESNVFFGIGVNPEYCNKGMGKSIIKLALDVCRIKYPNKLNDFWKLNNTVKI